MLQLLIGCCMTYEEKRRDFFAELAESIRVSDFPETYAEIARLAWHFTEYYAARGNKGAGRKLSLEKVFYIYVLMDPRFPGPWSYTLPGGKPVVFPFLPFYVGKGKGKRMLQHLIVARKKWSLDAHLSDKESRIIEIERAGFEILQKKISTRLVDALALAKERILIEALGRSATGTGPLTNLSAGGDGPGDTVWSPETQMRRTEGIRRFWETKSEADKAEIMAHLRAQGFSLGNVSGRTHSESTRTLFRRLAALRTPDYYEKSFHSPEARKKAALSLLGKPSKIKGKKMNLNAESWLRRSAASKAMVRTAEHGAKISVAKKNQEPVKCPHCSKIGHPCGMKTWHFDNCKFREP